MENINDELAKLEQQLKEASALLARLKQQSEESDVEWARLKQLMEEAHSQLDIIGAPRVVGTFKNQPLTVAGRLEWLRDSHNFVVKKRIPDVGDVFGE
jgi:septal ring factor EnvC (AmiA/AmiB activator)